MNRPRMERPQRQYYMSLRARVVATIVAILFFIWGGAIVIGGAVKILESQYLVGSHDLLLGVVPLSIGSLLLIVSWEKGPRL